MTIPKIDASTPNKSRFNGCKITGNDILFVYMAGLYTSGIYFLRNEDKFTNMCRGVKDIRGAGLFLSGFAWAWGAFASAKYLLAAADLLPKKKNNVKSAKNSKYEGFTITPRQAGTVFGLSLIAGAANAIDTFGKPLKNFKSKYTRAFVNFSNGFLVTAGAYSILRSVTSSFKTFPKDFKALKKNFSPSKTDTEKNLS